MNDQHMDCPTFEASLADFLDGDLDTSTYAACERHRADCAACQALVADLDAIVRAAPSLPLPAAPRDLWTGIEARLETPVRSLDAARQGPVAAPRVVWRRLAVAAVALVTVSAGVTWTLARPEPAAVVAVVPDTLLDTAPITRTAFSGGTALLMDTLYGREIAMLRTVADSNLGLLDSTTVLVVQRNLDIIDHAIRESREALAADPNSGFLLEQLDRAYERKVDLLRRLALL